MSPHQPIITEIKGHSLDDGAGIRSVIFFKGCPLACVWCHNPESISPRPELAYDAKACLQLGDCIAVCEVRALDPANPGFIDRERCTQCMHCIQVCASEALSLVGKPLTVEAVLQAIEGYQPFFEVSGGGVTLSGGEATLYLDYCEQLLLQLKARHIHVLLETAGLFNPARFLQQVYPHLDQIYFDIKLLDSASHRHYCGQDNHTILGNFIDLQQRARQGGVPVLARVPLIPEITATPENLTAIAAFLQANGVSQVALLPYNPLWLDKAGKIGRCGDYRWNTWLSAEKLAECRGYFGGLELV